MMKNVFNTTLHLLTSLIFVCLFSFCNKSTSSASTGTRPPPPPDTTTYQLVWSDEFNDDSIHTATWNFERGGNGWGNNEQEFYQAANASIENGNLVITAKKETAGSNGYTSARMTTQGKKEFEYGRIEARIKLPVAQGLWPAFWLLGANINTVGWPACGETDIMEHINTDSLIYGTIHWDNNGHVQDGGNTASSPAAYHVYSVEWTATTIKWYIDSVQYHESNIVTDNTEEFHLPFFIILNLAVGGNWPGQIIDDSLLPAKMYVDYVRVYQKK
jgi:beta-glucanase (GH16 family)